MKQKVAFAVALLLLVVLWAAHAWVVDDTYITLRVSDNFVHGLGLTWNPDERVQVYTHPLWMMLLTAFYAVIRNGFVASLGLSLVCFVGLVVWLRRTLEPARFWLAIALLVCSKAFFDFTSSGLENPLTDLLVAVFAVLYMQGRASFRTLVLIAALMFLNRMDTILLVLPVLLVELTGELVGRGWKAVADVAIGSAPAFAWLVFSLLYYGAPFPNTAYAKVLDNGLPAGAAWHQGWLTFANTGLWDAPTLVVMGLAVVAAVAARNRRSLAAAAGVVAYLVYVAGIGAISTHMSGRFFSGPYVLAVLVLMQEIGGRVQQWALAGGAVASVVLSPGAPLVAGLLNRPASKTGGGDPPELIDTRYFVHLEGAALTAWKPGVGFPDHGWYLEGVRFRGSPERVEVGGHNHAAIGYFAFGAGPDKYVMDELGLADPLLARLPMRPGIHWWPGHFRREVPAGYVESVREGDNQIVDPSLHELYDQIRLITRGPIFSLDRARAIWQLNTGHLAPLVDAYVKRQYGGRA